MLKNPKMLGEKISRVDAMNINQKNTLVFLLEFFFSIILYDQYISTPVKITKRGLYLVMPAKYEVPSAPKPRGASNMPPVQQSAANKDVNTDNPLKIFSFIRKPPIAFYYTIDIFYYKRKS